MRVYNTPVAQNLRVDRREFEAVIRAMLNTPPMPMAEIARKQKFRAKAKRKAKTKAQD